MYRSATNSGILTDAHHVQPAQERDPSFSIFVHAGSEYRTHPPIHRHVLVIHNTTIVWLSHDRSDVRSELQSFCWENLVLTGFTLFPLSPIHRHGLVMQKYHYGLIVYRSDAQSKLHMFVNLVLTDCTFIIINMGFIFPHLKLTCNHLLSMTHRHAFYTQNIVSWVLFFYSHNFV